MRVSIQIIFQPIMYCLLSFSIFAVMEEHLKKKDFGFDTEIVILELVEGVMNVFQNNEVIDVCKVAKPTKHTCYNLS